MRSSLNIFLHSGIAALALSLLLFGAVAQAVDSEPAPPAASAAAIELGDALASVNGVRIEYASFDAEYARLAAFSTAADQYALALDVVHGLINEQLVRQYAKANDIVVTDTTVAAKIAEIRAGLGEARWQAWLSENLYSADAFWHAVQQQFITREVLKTLTAHLSEDVPHVRARHILVAKASEAEEIINQLRSGANFGALAAAHSLDVATRDYGGDLGWFIRGELLDRRLEEAAFAQAAGAIGGPIATRLGYHALQVIALSARKVEAGRLPYLVQNIFNLWLEDQLEAADIHLNLPALDALLAPTPE